MRLEKRDHAARVAFERTQRGAAFFRVMAEIVDYRHAGRTGADNIETPGKAGECAQRSDGIGNRNAGGMRPGNRCQSIRQVMAAGNLEGQGVAVMPVA